MSWSYQLGWPPTPTPLAPGLARQVTARLVPGGGARSPAPDEHGRKDGLGSERGLATPSPDAKGRESLSPVDVDHAAGTLTHAKTQL